MRNLSGHTAHGDAIDAIENLKPGILCGRRSDQTDEAPDDDSPNKWNLAAPDLAAGAVGDRRPGRRGLRVCGFSARRRAAALAGHAARADRLRRLALPGVLGLRRQPAADQPGPAAPGEAAGAAEPEWRPGLLWRAGRLRRADPVEAGGAAPLVRALQGGGDPGAAPGAGRLSRRAARLAS